MKFPPEEGSGEPWFPSVLAGGGSGGWVVVDLWERFRFEGLG